MAQPLTLDDMTFRSKLEVSLPCVWGVDDYDPVSLHYFGIAPKVAGEIGMGDVSFGLSWSAAKLWMKATLENGGDGDLVEREEYSALGNLGIHFKYRSCLPSMGACTGVSSSIYLGLFGAHRHFGINDPSSWVKDRDVATLLGTIAHQEYGPHAAEHAVFRLMGIYAGSGGNMVYQVELGLIATTPLINTDFWERTWQEDLELAMTMGVEVGYRVTDNFIPMIEFRGELPLTDFYNLGTEPTLWANLGCRMEFGPVFPVLVIAIPIASWSKFGWNPTEFQFALGAAVRF